MTFSSDFNSFTIEKSKENIVQEIQYANIDTFRCL